MRHDESLPPTPRRRPLRLAAAAALLCLGLAGCGDGGGTAAAQAGPSGGTATTPPATPSPAPTKAAPSPSKSRSTPPSKAPSKTPPAPDGPLSGRTVVIDPGHNPTNHLHTAEINRQVDIGTGHKECDTTGTATNGGYAEAEFTLDVAHRLRTLLRDQGATVILTYDRDRAFGPCVDERARIGNKAHADAVVSIHADGSAVGNRGFHVILPASVRGGGADTSKIVAPSRDLGTRIAGLFVRSTGSSPSNYIGGKTGLDVRKDLGGLNLSTVPKVFIECGNMRDPEDAALLTDPGWRQKAAQGIADGISSYLKG
ncbi:MULTISPECIES: N-acetylmuramoyl-L-alanine amidase [unclassified Streptomyces]|uniref:N-acetylmuramoyl-L-alanine amidase n=1 Tax=unclassified Streptomyces TaxID=2593676 RepID=UPI002ED4780C|nr:N-acetylmuramoyl-L-alanine amidase [Streptomyces sp. NBC_00891]WSY05218.1 N-acetylmuramoyl-L-alanine amidase [Streptomyces sp. NBC_00890]WSZ06842.1 N-acetylmuramoyl-L-alanine amidase [Streptomyces sp. NBC_00869]WSZ25659.1 N-acetylmuramoyl-L-alanine amidase [Streptomyces sp. NBC_00870]